LLYLERNLQKLDRPKSAAICKSLPAASQSSRQSPAFNEKNRNRVSGVFRARHTGNGCTATAGFFTRRYSALRLQRAAAARFKIRASIESVPPIRKIKNREIGHPRRPAGAIERSRPGLGGEMQSG
jgi:hypothetical protein